MLVFADIVGAAIYRWNGEKIFSTSLSCCGFPTAKAESISLIGSL